MPSWGKIGEFVLSVVQIQRSVETLEKQNARLRDEIERLQRQVDEQGGQLRVLLAFVQTSLREQVETSAEKAAARLFATLIDMRVDRSDDPS